MQQALATAANQQTSPLALLVAAAEYTPASQWQLAAATWRRERERERERIDERERKREDRKRDE